MTSRPQAIAPTKTATLCVVGSVVRYLERRIVSGFRSSMITFFTSAFWHSIASGYYLTFFMGGFITTVARQACSTLRPLLLPPSTSSPSSPIKKIYDVLAVLLSITILKYSAPAFIILGGKESVKTWMALGWYGHVIVMGSLLPLYAGGKKWLMGVQRARGIVAPIKKGAVANGNVSVGAKANGMESGMSTPVGEKVFTMPPSLDQLAPPVD